MTSDPDDDDPTVEFPALTKDEDDDGPACGTVAAVTYFHLTYNDASGVQFARQVCCCFRHIPHPAEMLPESAELVEIVLQDAWARTVVRDGVAEVTVSGSEAVRPC